MKKLSIVILNYNTERITLDCINSIVANSKGVDCEIIVVDNASDEPFPESKHYTLVKSSINLGFAKGNNLARKYCHGQYILFLNSDTKVYANTLKECLMYIEADPSIGALTCRVDLQSGKLDPDTRRSFPTPWVSLTHFTYLDRLFSKSSIFAKYWYTYRPVDQIYEVDSLQGAFCLSPKKVLDKIGWFDEEYFLDGEDIDLCWKIRSSGYKIIYYPSVSILHLKGASKGKRGKSVQIDKKIRLKFVTSGVNSMEIFYKKRLWKNYPFIINISVLLAIKFIKFTRLIRVYLS